MSQDIDDVRARLEGDLADWRTIPGPAQADIRRLLDDHARLRKAMDLGVNLLRGPQRILAESKDPEALAAGLGITAAIAAIGRTP